VGEGPAAFVISSEVFPLIVRELGMSLAVSACVTIVGLSSIEIHRSAPTFSLRPYLASSFHTGYQVQQIPVDFGWHLGGYFEPYAVIHHLPSTRFLNFLLWVVSLLYVYETAGKSLEGINKKCK
jgi:hypothetical protein